MLKKSTESRYLPSFVLRSRVHTQAKKDLLENVLPKIEITPENIGGLLLERQGKKISLELGFGNGEHLLKKAIRHPDEVFIGCEPYANGVAQLIHGMQNNSVSNVRIYMGDARHILENLPDNSLTNIYVLFPDPWPKKRHVKRRIINDNSLSLFASKLCIGGRLLCATDHEDYAAWMLNYLQNNNNFILSPNFNMLEDFREPPLDWIETKYERKSSDRPYYFDNTRSR